MNTGIKLNKTLDEAGLQASPMLPSSVKNYLIDIDGTITDDVPNEEPWRMATVLPYLDAKEILNGWYNEGHIITFFTSRTDAHREVTETWLAKHNFKYHALLLNKPRGGNYAIIDNHLFKSYHFTGSWAEVTIEVFKD